MQNFSYKIYFNPENQKNPQSNIVSILWSHQIVNLQSWLHGILTKAGKMDASSVGDFFLLFFFLNWV